MRTLTATLLAAQQAGSHIPYVQVEAKNKVVGVIRLVWERLYEGSEDEYAHGLTVAGDGSLVRVRITLSADGCKLYRQRVGNPCLQSDFSTWTYTNQYDCLAVAVVSCGAEVSIFWLNGNCELRRLKSTDNGANWSSPELLDNLPSTDVKGMAASYKPNGDVAVFFAEQTTLYVKKCVAGNWQAKSAWDKTTGDLSGIAAVYDADWNLLVTGQDTDGNYKVWSLIYGDGGDVPAGSWSSLKELASAPAGGDYEYGGVFLTQIDVYRAFYVERFNGTQSYNRPFWTHSIPDAGFCDSLWREPMPFNLSCEYGVAIAHYGSYGWLSTANGVWRASLADASLDMTVDIISVGYEVLPGEGRLVVDLRNDDGRYQSPGEGALAVLKVGSQLEFSPGFVTTQGNEVSAGPAFWLEAWEHISSGGKCSLTLHGADGWRLLENWRARHQFRWNKSSEELSVKQILEFVLARVGLKLEVKSQSSTITGFFPDFTIHPDDRGDLLIGRLLALVPDMILIEGIKVYLVYPQSSDSSVYSVGQAHRILQGKYHAGGWQTNQVSIEGYDADSGEPIVVDSFDWEHLGYAYERTRRIADRNIGTVAAGQALGNACLRKAEIESARGMICVPVNCGQQLYDVIDITDIRTGMSNTKRRVVGILLSYRPNRAEYEQKILLGGV
ncbi:MAG: hypothetical protein PHY28_09425 [Dehalococcoidales bacterium]|nr:hypothetical protein [Dehalococcoidales bacterium]